MFWKFVNLDVKFIILTVMFWKFVNLDVKFIILTVMQSSETTRIHYWQPNCSR